MHCFEIGETVAKGLLIQREPFPHITTPEGSSQRLLLSKELADAADRAVPRAVMYPLLLEFAEMELQHGGVLLLRRDGKCGRKRAYRQKVSALIRVYIAAGEGGHARLLANSFDEICVGPKDEVGRVYHPYPAPGVHHFCTPERLKAVREGVEQLDVFMLMQPGAGFRIHRTGDLRDQDGVAASSQISVRWTGYGMPAVRGYDDRIPVLNPLPESLPAAAE